MQRDAWPITDVTVRDSDVRFQGEADIRLGSMNLCL
jgi:hypothetical protein